MSNQDDAVFVRNFSLVLIFLVVVGIIAFILAKLVNSHVQKTQNNDVAVAERLAPIGNANVGEPFVMAGEAAAGDEPAAVETADAAAAAPTDEATASAATGADRGKEVYDSACFICHATGVAGAPKLGDAAGWSARVAQGNDTLYSHAIEGFMGEAGLMPPKGGRTDLSDDDIRAAVDYMVSNSQ